MQEHLKKIPHTRRNKHSNPNELVNVKIDNTIVLKTVFSNMRLAQFITIIGTTMDKKPTPRTIISNVSEINNAYINTLRQDISF